MDKVELLIIVLWVCLAIGAAITLAGASFWVAHWISRFIARHWPNPPKDWRDEYAPKCRECGFDLRESIERCPECGTEMSGYDRAIVWHLTRLRSLESPIEHMHATAGRHGEIAAVNRLRQ